MAVIRDMIPAFELFQPATVEDAVALLSRYGENAWVLAGGLDSMDWFKDRIKRPEAVVALEQIEELCGVREAAGGFEIGALTTLSEIAAHPGISERFRVLAGGWPCYRAGGNTCYAGTSQSMNREHAVLGARRCVAVNASDTAPALIALDAKLVIWNGRGERVVDAEDYFIGPATDITRMTVLEPGDLLTAVRIPGSWAGLRFYFEKVRDRQSWDFALVNVATALNVSGDRIEEARIVVNGVAPFPVRLHEVETALRGRPANEATASAAAELAIEGTRALRHNDFKLPLMRNLVRRSIRDARA
jgi:xanthine dehydrogenase YagS FAD-binding subunit